MSQYAENQYAVWFVPAIMGAGWSLMMETDDLDDAFHKARELRQQQYQTRITRLEVIWEHKP